MSSADCSFSDVAVFSNISQHGAAILMLTDRNGHKNTLAETHNAIFSHFQGL